LLHQDVRFGARAAKNLETWGVWFVSIGAFVRQAGMASGVILILSATMAPAAGAASKASVRAVRSAPTAYTSAKAPTAPAEPSAAVETVPEPGCSRARKKLWVDGEGWIVRRVTTCF
jgi:hypothetical protein